MKQSLNLSRTSFQAIVNECADGVVVLTAEGTIAFINPAAAAMLNQRPQELIGQSFGIPLTVGHTNEIHLMNTDGEPCVAEMLVTETSWHDEPAYIATLRDITQHKHAEEVAQAAIRQRDEFLATLSHELRNPLAAVSNAVQLLRSSHAASEQAVSAQQIISRQCEQLRRLLDDLLDVTRISQGRIELRKEALDLREVVHEAVATVQPFLQEREHQLVIYVPQEAVAVNGDPARLTQVVINLLINAAKFTHDGGQIRVYLEVSGDQVVLRVVDNGVGLCPHLLESVFEPFVQIQPQGGDLNSGMGIGLSLVRKLVELHGGTARAESEGLGRGSQFVVSLPRIGEVKRRPVHLEPSALLGSLQILLVEDNADIRDTLRTLLQMEGHNVETAGDGLAAVEMMKACPPQVALIDIGLPGIDGYEVARRIKAEPDGLGIHLVALTGYGQPQDKQRSREAGFSAHLVKPVRMAELLRVLAKLQPLERR